MIKLPYIIPDNDRFLNVGLLLLIIQSLGKTSRGKLLLNNERILIFMYLVKNPPLIVEALGKLGRPIFYLTPEESHSVSSISVNLDPLFDNAWIKELLRHVASLGLLQAKFRKGDGFLYALTEKAENMTARLSGDYFDRVRDYLSHLESIKAETTSSLHSLLNNIFKR